MRAPLAYLFDAATVIALGGYTLLATITHVWEFDFIRDWGLKARIFFLAGGVDWAFLEDVVERGSHPDYPPLLPLSFDLFAVIRGGWDDRWIGLINVAFAAAALLIVRRELIREVPSRTAAAFGTLALLPLVALPWIGIADGPLAALVLCAPLLIRRAIADDDSRAFTTAAILLGIGAFTKNEGLTFIVAVALGLAAAGKWRLIPRLWPSVAIALPWLVLRSVHTLPTDLAEGNVLARMIDHVMHPAPLLIALAKYPVGKPIFWIAMIAGVLLTLRMLLRYERLVLVTVAVQFACYIAAYLSTPHGMDWHVRWSWDRLIAHVAAPLAYVVLAELLRRISATPDAPSPDRAARLHQE